MTEGTKGILWGALLGFVFAAGLNTLSFSDAEKYRKAKRDCEQTLPRNQHCTVIGVPQ